MKRIHAVAGAIVSIIVLALCLVGGYASAVPNNVTGDDCSTIFAGSVEIPRSDMTWSGGDNEPSVTVWTVDIKWFVYGYVVKGGNGYNTFSAGEANNPMTAPNNSSGGPAAVSHWFACGLTEEETTETTTTTTTVETTTETSETTTSETTSETTTSETTTDTTTSTTETSDTTTSETTSGTETTTPSDTTSQTSESTSSSSTTPPVVTTSDSSSVAVPTTTVVSLESNPDDLAYTGMPPLWVVLLGGLGLVAAGLVALLVTRRRKK